MAQATVAPSNIGSGAAPASTDGIYPDIQAAIAAAAAKGAASTSTANSAGKATGTGAGGTPVQTPLQAATAEANYEVGSEVSPIRAEIATLTKQGQQQQNTVSAEFAQLLPYAKQSAQLTGAFNAAAEDSANAIFQAANQNQSQIAQNASQQAQQMAQTTGAPVATNTVTGPMSEFQQAQQQTGEVGQLTNLELGSSSTAEAAQFAGQVLPAMMQQQDGTIRAAINDKISTLQSDIAKIEGTKGKLINAKLPELQKAQLTAQLDEQKIALQKLDDSHKWDYQTTQLAQKAAEIAWTEQYDTGKLGVAQKTVELRAQALTATEKATAAKLGLTAQEYALRASQYAVSDQLAQSRLAIEQQRNTISAINAITGGSTSTKPITMTTVKYLNANDPLAVEAASYSKPGSIAALTGKKAPTNVFYDPKRNQWYTYVKQEMTPEQWHQKAGIPGTPVSDPNALYNLLMHLPPAERPSPQYAQQLIRFKLGIPDWQPGQNANPSHVELTKMSTSQLYQLASSRGFSTPAPSATRQQMIDWVRKSSPGYKTPTTGLGG